ncbi:MAG: type II toxin-antitoxin system Phd/YefM family antitoxin [Candidatus Pacebacteria bacterium]|jgi:antitoxin YefM|nr:type II toxin-antitoxin system Phd/YefM family antitoxin [Candidatus Paceibacterota bacterium]MBT4359094.1 type II toxin-antitoxin system Phd/YefM family antitoxin [Candidatus Paceibacterota bacterium]MBT6899046.1 type II toxin-antitoxin system Phd/YefM family antitoxin [Candidatus Paceibacterota bacterium]MBT7183568.1 type II toxin-antitoxin system Phd/YefM family antitoxin [Candidatus Paceibacterota bacterium]MBT7499533.1 type II toxin-antitoxin system Phd/YefM family antitoxin [Candidatus
MNNTIPISQARSGLSTLIDQVSARDIFITVKGKIKAALVDAEEYVSLLETLEVLSDKETMKNIRQGEKDIANGDTVSWEDLKKNLT